MSTEPARYIVLSHKTIVAWAVLIVVAGTGLAVWLLIAYGHRDPLGAIRTAGTVVVGSGGGAALLLAARRQRAVEIALQQKDRDQTDVARTHALQEQVAAENRADALERRITDLYTKAVEQLGSDKAPVRLGGLYALERLAQDNERQRQTIVNVLCAYLRMPYQLPDPDDEETLAARRQEREVRMTAQRLITDHLRSDLSQFWRDIAINLAGATLIDFALLDGAPRWASFKSATFTGPTVIAATTFPDYTSFEGARFTGSVNIVESTFQGKAQFDGATFDDIAIFDGWLQSERVTFQNEAGFQKAKFNKRTSFSGARFHRSASYREATFDGEASFHSARFLSDADFGDAVFAGKADFTAATFAAGPPGIPQLGVPTTSFISTTFTEGVPPEVVRFTTFTDLPELPQQ